MSSRTLDFGVLYTGKTMCIPVDITNNSGVTAQDVIVKLNSLPTGTVYKSHNLPRGTFDSNTNIWSVGDMTPGEVLVGDICFDITDDGVARPYNFTFSVGLSEFCEDCEEDPFTCIIANGIPCADLSFCCDGGITTVTTNYQMKFNDYTLFVDNSSSSIVLDVEPADVHKAGCSPKYDIKIIGADPAVNSVLLRVNSGAIVDFTDVAGGVPSFSFTTLGEILRFQSDGTNLYILT